jgi:integrase
MRRVMQRANILLGTNWSLHDLRHTAAYRMANGGKLTLPEVQTIMRHADIQTTNRYLDPRELHQTGQKSQVASSGRRADELPRYYELTS